MSTTEVMGVYSSMSNNEYHHSSAISKSGLDQLAKSPAHLWYARQKPTPPTPAMIVGSFFHDLVLTPKLVPSTYARKPKLDLRTTKGKEMYEEWLKEHHGLVHIDECDWLMVEAMRDSVMMHPTTRQIIEKSQSLNKCENSHFWIDDETFSYCRVRPDIAVPEWGLLCDLKSTDDLSPFYFSKSFYEYRYHVQQAMYTDGVLQTEQWQAENFLFIAVEKTASNPITITYQLDAKGAVLGYETYRRDLARYAELMDNPQLMLEPIELSLPYYAYPKGDFHNE